MVHPLQQVARDEILEPRAGPGYHGPIEVVVLALLLHGPNTRRTKRRNAEYPVQALNNIQPRRDGLVGHLKILAQGIHGQRRTYQVGQAQHHLLQPAQIADGRERCHVPFDQAGSVLARPASCLDVPAAEKRLRKAPEAQQLGQAGGSVDPHLGDRERMQPQEVVPALKRVAAETEQLESAASRHEHALVFPTRVVEAFEEAPPSSVLVYLVKDPKIGGRELSAQDALPVLVRVPVQIALIRTWQAPRQRGLAHLAWAGHEHHLAFQIKANLISKVSLKELHAAEITTNLYMSQIY